MSETTLNVRPLVRVFRYGALELEDPDSHMTVDEVKDFWGDVYPELTQAVTEGPEYKDDRAEYTFRRAVGTKGSRTEGKANDEMADALQLMEDLAHVLALETPGDDPLLLPWQELEPV